MTRAFVKTSQTTAKMTQETENPAVPSEQLTQSKVDSTQFMVATPQTLGELESVAFTSIFQSGQDTNLGISDGQSPSGQGPANKSEYAGIHQLDVSRKSFVAVSNFKPESAKQARSLRIHLGIKESDNGFERIFRDLSCIPDDVGRSQHIKRLLVAVGLSIDVSSWPPLATVSQSGEDQRSSFNINFRFSSRDSGLEALNTKLCQMPISTHRNQFVKRLLFNAYVSVPKQALTAQSLSQAQQATQVSQTLSPTQTSTPAPTANPVLISTPYSKLTPTAKTSTSSKSTANTTTAATGFGSLDSFTSWSTGEETPVANMAENRSPLKISLKRKSSIGGLGT